MTLRSILPILGVWLLATTTVVAQRPGRGRPDVNLKVGDAAPDFKLKTLAGKETTLAGFAGQKPVALLFGSCT